MLKLGKLETLIGFVAVNSKTKGIKTVIEDPEFWEIERKH